MDDWFESMVTKMVYRKWNAKERMTDDDVRTLGARMVEKAGEIYGTDSPMVAETQVFVDACVRREPYDTMRLRTAEVRSASRSRHPSRRKH